jgi:hypothetical protein
MAKTLETFMAVTIMSSLLGCDAVQTGRSLRMFWRNIMPPSSGLNKPSILQAVFCLHFEPDGGRHSSETSELLPDYEEYGLLDYNAMQFEKS